MASRLFNRPDLDELVVALNKPSALVELGVFFVCLLAAWMVVRLIRGPSKRPGSVLFGERLIDGVLFPVLALGVRVRGALRPRDRDQAGGVPGSRSRSCSRSSSSASSSAC